MKRELLAIGAAVAFAATVGAKGAAQPAPSRSIFGMEAGKPVPYPRCVDNYTTKEICFNPMSVETNRSWDEAFIRFPSDQIPEIMASYVMSVKTVHGRIVGYNFEASGFRGQDRVIDLLSQKFGKPTAIQYQDMGTLAGGNFRAAAAAWEFSDLSIKYDSLGYGTRAGRVEIFTTEGQSLKQKLDEAEKSKRVPL